MGIFESAGKAAARKALEKAKKHKPQSMTSSFMNKGCKQKPSHKGFVGGW